MNTGGIFPDWTVRRQIQIRFLFFLFLVLASTASTADDLFPQPPELKPDVDFWISIFTEYSSSEGVLHDNRDLGVVYERLQMPSKLSRRVRLILNFACSIFPLLSHVQSSASR